MEKRVKISQNELRIRNEQIFERYMTLCEAQPLATHNKVLCHLAAEYNLTPQQLGRIIINQQHEQDNESN